MSKTKKTGKKKNAALKNRIAQSVKARRHFPVPANIKREPGDKLTDWQRMQLIKSHRDLHGNEVEPVEIEVQAVEVRETMKMIEFDRLKAEAKKKKRGFRKYAESKGWEFTGSGDFKESHQDWTKPVEVEA